MSDRILLEIDGTVLPVEQKHGMDVSLSDGEIVKETEAGTFKRSIYRSNIPSISVKFWCDLEMLQQMREYKDETSVTVRFFDPTQEADNNGDRLKTETMYVTNFKQKMLADTDDGGFWEVSFDLEDLRDV